MRSKEDELLISCCDKNLSGTFRELQNLVEEEGLSVSNSLRVIQNQIMPPSFLSRFLFDLYICIEFDAIEIRRV